MKRFLTIFLLLLCAAGLAAAEDVYVINADATSWIEGKDPSAYVPYRMIDGVETTAFQFSTKTTPLGKAYVYFYFSAPSRVDALWIKNGFWKITDGLDQYTRNSRVKSMTVAFQYDGSSSYADAQTVTLPDDSQRQDWTRISLGTHQNVVSVRFLIKSIYQGTKYKNDVCISEVRFIGSGSSAPSSASPLYGLAKQKLATRDGPGTTYNEKGTYNVAGQYIRVLSRAWDSRNRIWWVKCEIPYRNEIRVLWTGYKRFDSSTLPLESIPIEGQGSGSSGSGQSSGGGSSAGGPTAVPPITGSGWSDVFRRLVMNGLYRYAGPVYDTMDDVLFSLFDFDRDGTPELITSNGDHSMAGRINYVYVFRNGSAVYAGDVGFRDSILQFYPGSAYPGLFCRDGNMGVYTTEYYSLSGAGIRREAVAEYRHIPDNDPYGWLDEPIVSQLTSDTALFALVNSEAFSDILPMYTLAQINARGGWDQFVAEFSTVSAAGAVWQTQYRSLFTSGQYRNYLYNSNPEYHSLLMSAGPQNTSLAIHDLDRDGTPELLVRTDYGIEQIDVFTVSGGSVLWLGTMGGDNFFQDVFWLNTDADPGVITLKGGPAMTMDRYTVQNHALTHTPLGRTLVDSNGEETVGLQMYVSDSGLYQTLYNMLVLNQNDAARSITWLNGGALNTDAAWSAFWSTLQSRDTGGEALKY